MKRCNDTKSTADRNKSNVDTVLAKIEADKKAVKSVIVGQDERLDWILFNQFVNNALPRPDASNLSVKAKKLFWNQSAKDAYQNYKLLNISKLKPGETTPDEEEWRGDLLQANVEGMYCVYCLDLAKFHAKLKADKTVQWETMLPADWAKAPEGKGWIAEVRGYTYYHDGLKFIHDTLVDNLASMPIKPEFSSADGTAAPGGAGPANPGAVAGNPSSAAANPAGSPGGSDAPSGKAEHPIWNRVSHVVIYQYLPDANPDPGPSYKLIGQHVLDSLLGAGVGGPGGPGGPMPGKQMSFGPGALPGGSGEGGAGADRANQLLVPTGLGWLFTRHGPWFRREGAGARRAWFEHAQHGQLRRRFGQHERHDQKPERSARPFRPCAI